MIRTRAIFRTRVPRGELQTCIIHSTSTFFCCHFGSRWNPPPGRGRVSTVCRAGKRADRQFWFAVAPVGARSGVKARFHLSKCVPTPLSNHARNRELERQCRYIKCGRYRTLADNRPNTDQHKSFALFAFLPLWCFLSHHDHNQSLHSWHVP